MSKNVWGMAQQPISEMTEKFVKKSFNTLHLELRERLRDQKQGFVLSTPVGESLFPESLPPSLEIVLLDPEEMTVAFRKISALRGGNRKKGEWNVGPVAAAVEKIIAWVDQMISLKMANSSYEVTEI